MRKELERAKIKLELLNEIITEAKEDAEEETKTVNNGSVAMYP